MGHGLQRCWRTRTPRSRLPQDRGFLERAGVPRSAAIKLTGQKTEAVYRRYAITDSAMLQEAAAKLDPLHTAEANSTSSGQVTQIPAVGQ